MRCSRRPTPTSVETHHLVGLGLPDKFIEHGERAELLKDLGLDVEGGWAGAPKAIAFHVRVEAPRAFMKDKIGK